MHVLATTEHHRLQRALGNPLDDFDRLRLRMDEIDSPCLARCTRCSKSLGLQAEGFQSLNTAGVRTQSFRRAISLGTRYSLSCLSHIKLSVPKRCLHTEEPRCAARIWAHLNFCTAPPNHQQSPFLLEAPTTSRLIDSIFDKINHCIFPSFFLEFQRISSVARD